MAARVAVDQVHGENPVERRNTRGVLMSGAWLTISRLTTSANSRLPTRSHQPVRPGRRLIRGRRRAMDPPSTAGRVQRVVVNACHGSAVSLRHLVEVGDDVVPSVVGRL
jgi:hypothetical protein